MNSLWFIFAAVVIIVFILVITLIQTAIKIVPEEKQIIVFRLGKSMGSRGPGLVVVVPIIDRAVWVDIQKSHHFSYVNLPTRDNRQASLIVNLKGKIFDTEKSVLNVPNLENALYQLIETRVRDFSERKSSNELLKSAGQIEDELRDALNRSGRDWGFGIIEIQVDDIRTV